MSRTPFPIMNFIGHPTCPKGVIKPPTKGGTQKGRTCMVMVDYVIIDLPLAYNIIMGRPLLNSLRATPLT